MDSTDTLLWWVKKKNVFFLILQFQRIIIETTKMLDRLAGALHYLLHSVWFRPSGLPESIYTPWRSENMCTQSM